ncbi:PEP-CTERM sorting domain-containing protein [Parahaliea mediterranea]|uniref:PEP-CTERM sorting domain-containing protein n=1 Tax=Parahaliea mediterranea TaxID=651086 RepID=A0A939DIU1_9GAMM|nr:PEP-CTERM sorting domain-containing protein [Parahaliea mediterranea]MBN7798322.1 PEP-CTERM sorting domain-containing protein [Parahaliea mediterranea]
MYKHAKFTSVNSGLRALAGVLVGGLFAIQNAHAGLLQVNYSDLSGVAGADFEDLGLGNNQQVTFNNIFESGNTSFGESFAGQTVTPSGNFDVLSGAPTGPLTLVAGSASVNVTAVDGGAGDVGNTAIAGSGPLGYPDADAVGEGSIAILFDFDQSEFGFDVVGGNGGTATAQFWARDGSLLDEIIFSLSSDIFQPYGFVTDDGLQSVAGVSIFNNDPGGIGFDNFIFDVAGVPGTPGSDDPIPVSEPSTLPLLCLSLFGLAYSRRKRVR